MKTYNKNKFRENLCIIPARKGSKGIKNKNIISFCGKPLIQHTFDTAKKIKNEFDILVSTDSDKIRKLALKNKFYFLGSRPKILSGDKVETKDVLKYELKRIEKLKKKNTRIYFYFKQLALLETQKRFFLL